MLSDNVFNYNKFCELSIIENIARQHVIKEKLHHWYTEYNYKHIQAICLTFTICTNQINSQNLSSQNMNIWNHAVTGEVY